MIATISETTTLNNGVDMPWLGFGTYRLKDGQEVESAVRWALNAGYRSIDTASIYGNERGVGKVLQESAIPRNEIFVTSKVWNDEQGYDETLKAFERSLRKLGLEELDLYLIHWPVRSKFHETWRALERLYEEKRVRAIGVSNFLIHHLEELLPEVNVMPAVNQVELHPYMQESDLVAFCRERNIQIEAWSPLMKGKIAQDAELQKIAANYGKTPAQVALRWELQNGFITIPKSARKERIEENADIFDFELGEEDMQRIAALDREERVGPDPDRFS